MTMTLRRSEAVLRLLVGLALGFGFLGFVVQGRSADQPWTKTPQGLVVAHSAVTGQ